MDVPHAVYNHADHHTYTIPTGSCTERVGESEIVSVAMQEEIITQPMVSSYGHQNPHTSAATVHVPWMEGQLSQKAPPDGRDVKEDVKVRFQLWQN